MVSAPHALTDEPEHIGPYRILTPLGQGGMGVVYLARHIETDDICALKTVSIGDPGLLSSIRREIHALRQVEHPGVVRIVDEGVEGGLPWYAMELLEGRTLRDYNNERWRQQVTLDMVAQGEPTSSAEEETRPSLRAGNLAAAQEAGLTAAQLRPFREAASGALGATLRMFRAICAPLAYIHGLGLVHRDLKPENIFLREDNTPVLVDFGLAVQFETKGRHGLELQFGGKTMGSPSYMAPEHIRGDLVDARADLYALGCMLYEAVTGTVPFVAAQPAVVLSMHLYGAPVSPTKLVEGVSPELDALILRLLKKRPDERFGYAEDLARALAIIEAQSDAASAPDSLVVRGPRPQPYLYRPGLAGRAEALLGLLEMLKRLHEERRGAIVLVAGESGIGKTRLAMEVATEGARLHMMIVTGECVAVSAGDAEARGGVKGGPLHPFRNLLLAAADRCRAEGPDEYDRVLGPRGHVLAPYEPSLATLPGHDRYPEPADLPADAARFRLRSAVADVMAALAENAPLVLVLDDLQWADESTMDVLAHLEEAWTEAHPVLVLGTYRTEEETPAIEAIGSVPGVSLITLGRLDARAVARMVSDMLAIDRPPDEFILFLLEQSEGNPFFIAEYLHTAVEEGVLRRDDEGVWRIRDEREREGAEPGSGALPVPRSLRDLVLRRLSGLGSAARALSRMAAVLGREMEEDVLVAAASIDVGRDSAFAGPSIGDIETMEGLRELAVRHVLTQAGPGRLRFEHEKLREFIYGALEEDERREAHAAAARAIEARYAGSPDLALSYAVLAHHYAIAGIVHKTIEYLEKAGERALATGASGEAQALYERAIALDDARPETERAPPIQRGR